MKALVFVLAFLCIGTLGSRCVTVNRVAVFRNFMLQAVNATILTKSELGFGATFLPPLNISYFEEADAAVKAFHFNSYPVGWNLPYPQVLLNGPKYIVGNTSQNLWDIYRKQLAMGRYPWNVFLPVFPDLVNNLQLTPEGQNYIDSLFFPPDLFTMPLSPEVYSIYNSSGRLGFKFNNPIYLPYCTTFGVLNTACHNTPNLLTYTGMPLALMLMGVLDSGSNAICNCTAKSMAEYQYEARSESLNCSSSVQFNGFPNSVYNLTEAQITGSTSKRSVMPEQFTMGSAVSPPTNQSPIDFTSACTVQSWISGMAIYVVGQVCKSKLFVTQGSGAAIQSKTIILNPGEQGAIEPMSASVYTQALSVYVDINGNLTVLQSIQVPGISWCKVSDCIICTETIDTLYCMQPTVRNSIYGLFAAIIALIVLIGGGFLVTLFSFLYMCGFAPAVWLVTGIWRGVSWLTAKVNFLGWVFGRTERGRYSQVKFDVENLTQTRGYFIKAEWVYKHRTVDALANVRDNAGLGRDIEFLKDEKGHLKVRTKAFIITTLLLFNAIGAQAGCENVLLLQSSQQQCTVSQGIKSCTIITDSIITLPAKQATGCLTIADETGNVIVDMSIQYLTFADSFPLANQYYTSDVDLHTWDRRDCAKGNSYCSEANCANLDARSKIPNPDINPWGFCESTEPACRWPGLNTCVKDTGNAGCALGMGYLGSPCISGTYGLKPTGAIWQVLKPTSPQQMATFAISWNASVANPNIPHYRPTIIGKAHGYTASYNGITVSLNSFGAYSQFNPGQQMVITKGLGTGSTVFGLASQPGTPQWGMVGDIQGPANLATAFDSTTLHTGNFDFDLNGPIVRTVGASFNVQLPKTGIENLNSFLNGGPGPFTKMGSVYGSSIISDTPPPPSLSGPGFYAEPQTYPPATMRVQTNMKVSISTNIFTIAPDLKILGSAEGCFSCSEGYVVTLIGSATDSPGILTCSNSDCMPQAIFLDYNVTEFKVYCSSSSGYVSSSLTCQGSVPSDTIVLTYSGTLVPYTPIAPPETNSSRSSTATSPAGGVNLDPGFQWLKNDLFFALFWAAIAVICTVVFIIILYSIHKMCSSEPKDEKPKSKKK